MPLTSDLFYKLLAVMIRQIKIFFRDEIEKCNLIFEILKYMIFRTNKFVKHELNHSLSLFSKPGFDVKPFYLLGQNIELIQ